MKAKQLKESNVIGAERIARIIWIGATIILFCSGMLCPAEVGAYAVYYRPMNTGSGLQICSDMNAPNYTESASVDPPLNSFVPITMGAYWSGGADYHLNWSNGASEAATSLADDMYLPVYDVAHTINSFRLNLTADVYPDVKIYAKFYDVDTASACPPFEGGVLIGSTPTLDWNSSYGGGKNAVFGLTGLNYTLPAGHTIRVELWIHYNWSTFSITAAWINVNGTANATTTVGPGNEIPNAVVAPGESAEIDAFTIQTSAGTDSIRYIQAYVPAWNYLQSIAITSDDGSVTYGNSLVQSQSAQQSIIVHDLIATTSSTQYRVKVYAKSHDSLPSGALNVTGWIDNDGLLSFNSVAYGDTSSALLTIDNQPPGNPEWQTVLGGVAQVDLAWSNPPDPDFSNVLLLRNTSPVADSPVDGNSYVPGDILGSSTVRYCDSGTTFSDNGLAEGYSVYYKLFSLDENGNYSSGAGSGPHSYFNLTIGDGSGPPDLFLYPGSTASVLDSFTLQTSYSSTSVTALDVTLASGTAAALSLVEITSDNETQVYGSVANPISDTITIPLSTVITATSTPIGYKIRITPKTDDNMPPPDAIYAVEGVVSSAATNPAAIVVPGDTTSATITIDNLPPPNPVWGAVTPGDRNIALHWTNPDDANFSQVLILESTTEINDAPVNGSVYAFGDILGSSTVRYVGSGQKTTDNYVSNGISYYFKIFTRDTGGYYSDGSGTGPYMPNPVLTVGDGTDPANSEISPGGPAAMLDAFTLSLSGSYYSNYVTSLALALSAGTAEALTLVEVVSDNGATVYGSVANPGSDTVTIPVGINVYSGAPVQYKVRITPESHAAMPPPPGSACTISGRITALTTSSGAIKQYNDASSATITIDNLSAGNPVWGAPELGEKQITLNWTNPADSDFSRVIILRKTTSISDKPVEGRSYSKGDYAGGSSVVFAESGQSFTDTGLSGSVVYYYKIFAMDTSGNYSTGKASTPLQPIGVNSTTAGTAFATAGLRRITVSTPYLNDDNLNNSCQFDYKLSFDTSWTPWGNSSCGNAMVIQDLSSDNTYDIKVTYQDTDGVIGVAEQIISSVRPYSEKLVHNSRTTGSFYWAPMGWGIAGGMYGEFTCETCHMKNAPNISRIKDMIELEGFPPRMVSFLSRSGPDSYGDDTEPRFAPVTSRICEVCHTLTNGLQSTPMDPLLIGPIHQYEQPEPANHFNANGTDRCTCCHTHDTGFAIPQGPPFPSCQE